MKNNIHKFILDSIKPFKFLIFGQFIVGFIWAIDLSIRPYILKIIIDKISIVNSNNIIQEIKASLIIYLMMSLILVIAFRIDDYIWIKLNPGLKRHIGDILMRRMMSHSMNILNNNFSGNLANKIKDVMSGVPDMVKLIVENFLSNFLSLIIAVLTVCSINYKFSILLLTWIIIFFLGTYFFTKKGKILWLISAEARSNVIGHFVDILSNILNVHLFAAKDNESKNLKIHLDNYVIADQKRDWWLLYMYCFQGLSFVIYNAIAFILLIVGFKTGNVTAGDFILLASINIAIIGELWSLSGYIASFSEIWGNINQGLNIVLQPIEIEDKPNAKELKVLEGKIIFESVKFQYKDANILFQNKSITIEAGQKIGLVGYSGSGKSTFVNLILRLYDINDGQILIDNQDISDVTQDSLHNNIAMIPQDPSLFHRSLIENIRYGRSNASDNEVIIAAKKAHAHDFIMATADGYDSLVGERGVKLSGGQRQRIAIARAILKEAPILILDEATSALDSITETDIQDNLNRLMQNKTTIVIAHRLSTLLNMDRIFVFDKGTIIEDGTHSELIIKNGLYNILWNTQVGGFIIDT